MTVSFRKSFIGNEGKKRAKAIWLATEIDMTQRIYIYGGRENAKKESKREANESSEKRHGKQSPFAFSFGSKADFAISNFHHSARQYRQLEQWQNGLRML